MNRHLLFLALLLTAAVWSHDAAAATLLAVDINDRTAGDPAAGDAANTPAGFESWTIDTGTTASATTATRTLASGYTVRFDAFDDHLEDGGAAGDQAAAIDDRDRATPASGTLKEIYDDFIFAGASAGPTGGMDMIISGGALAPNTQYRVSLYSWDNEAAATTTRRVANWIDLNNSNALVLTTDWVDDTPPSPDTQYRFTGIARTDGGGALRLGGRGIAPPTPQTDPQTNNGPPVYVDGLEVSTVPEPTSLAMIVAAAGLTAIRGRRRGAPTSKL